MVTIHELILVIGATGAQGGATARCLLESGQRVRIATRAADGAAAKTLVAAGAEAVTADLDDAPSLRAALEGVSAVFSMQNPGPREIDQGLGLVNEALRAGVRQFVHTSVTGTAEHTSFPGWGSGRWTEGYWTAKWTIEEAVRSSPFPHYTVLRPAFMMDNFIPPKVDYMFPSLRRGELAGALRATTVLQLISAQDVGRFAAAAFLNPQAFDRRSIDLAAEAPTVAHIAATLSRQLGRSVRATEQTPEQALRSGLFPGWVRSQEWTNEVGYRASIETLARYPVALTPFADWITAHRQEFNIA